MTPAWPTTEDPSETVAYACDAGAYNLPNETKTLSGPGEMNE